MQILAAVSRADVVVVNPTHFSVGLRYDRSKDRAPRVVTKGDDEDALAIRTVALERGVPIIENPPVARALFEACEIGDEVPGVPVPGRGAPARLPLPADAGPAGSGRYPQDGLVKAN